jgi:hypothetical protein
MWTRTSEFEFDPDDAIVAERKSAVIMLVLDCSSSLSDSDLQSIKTAANNFITTLSANTQ